MTLSEIHDHMENYDGYCTACKAVTTEGGVEPDAEGYECPECGGMTVMGVEQAAGVHQLIPITGGEDFEGNFDE